LPNKGNFSEAVSAFHIAIKNEPSLAQAYFNNYRQALEIREDFAPAANNLAWILAEHGGNIDEALGLAQTAKEKMPRDPSPVILYHLGMAYLKNNQREIQFCLKDILGRV